MGQTIVKLTEQQDRMVQVVKGKYGFKNKDVAIRFIITEFVKNHLEPELRPEYVKKIQYIEKRGKFKEYKSPSQLWNDVEHA